MTRAERSRIRVHLAQLIHTEKEMPVSKEIFSRGLRKSPFYRHFAPFGMRAIAAFVIVLLVASTGVSFAAENTLPGDLLFGVKVNVNEELKSALISNSTAKMKYEKERVVRRVVETETLMKKKALTPARKKDAEAAIKKQIVKFSASAAEENKNNPTAVIAATAELEPELKAHSEVIATLSTDETADDTASILSTVAGGIAASSSDEASAINVASEKNPNSLPGLIDGKIDATETAIGKTDIPAQTDTTVTIEGDSIEILDNAGGGEGTDANTVVENSTDPTASAVATPMSLLRTDAGDIATDTKSTAGSDELKSTTSLKVSEKILSESRNADSIIAGAKKKLELAKKYRAEGKLKEALLLAQDAYKDVFGLNVSTNLDKADKANQTKDTKPTSEAPKSPTTADADVKTGETTGVSTKTDPVKTDPKTPAGTTTSSSTQVANPLNAVNQIVR